MYLTVIVVVNLVENMYFSLIFPDFPLDVDALGFIVLFIAPYPVNYYFYLQADHRGLLMVLDELFVFFTTSPSKNIFKNHLIFLVKNCNASPFQFLCKYFADEGLW